MRTPRVLSGLVVLALAAGMGLVSISQDRAKATPVINEVTREFTDGDAVVTARIRVQDATANASGWWNATAENVVVDVHYEHNGTAIRFVDETLKRPTVSIARAGEASTLSDWRLAPVNSSRTRARGVLYNTDGRFSLTLNQHVIITKDGQEHEIHLDAPQAVEFGLKRDVRMEMNVAPRIAPSGKTVKVFGSITATDDGSGYAPVADRAVDIYLDPTGSEAKRKIATVTSSSTGTFSTSFTAASSGVVSAEYAGSATEIAATMAEDIRVHTGTGYREKTVTIKVGEGSVKARVFTPSSVTVGTKPVALPIDVEYIGGWNWEQLSGTVEMSFSPRKVGFGDRFGPNLIHTIDKYTARGTIWIDGMAPPGTYAISLNGTAVGSITVKKVTATSIRATPPASTTSVRHRIGGTVKAVNLASATWAPAWRLVAGLGVRLYFDPAGTTGPRYRATVKTNSSGAYSYSVAVTTPGRWVARYPGSASYAPSEALTTTRQATLARINASTKTPVRGTRVTFTGDLKAVKKTSVGARWRPLARTTVKIYFDPAGSAGPVLKRTLTTTSTGTYRTSIQVQAKGYWIVKYAGTTRYAPDSRRVLVDPR
ncbi:hypothetical protein [Nocardioides sp. NPDC127503]|uniref:hypothetical protein n=1 Tax=Nocardioides sp. NPDC127503 TaxID=3154516 RepID=UPI00331A4ED7